MELQFNKVVDRFVAKFTTTSDFNLHIEGVVEGSVSIFQRGSETGDYAYVRGGSPNPSYGKVYDCDFSALVYPKHIMVTCVTEPSLAVVTFNA